jgi:hypothetical protein
MLGGRVKQYRLPATCGFSAWAPQMCFICFSEHAENRESREGVKNGTGTLLWMDAGRLYLGHSLLSPACPDSADWCRHSRRGPVRRPAISGDERWNRHLTSHLGRGLVNSFPAAATLGVFNKGSDMRRYAAIWRTFFPHVYGCKV